jgi:hypothetical protein
MNERGSVNGLTRNEQRGAKADSPLSSLTSLFALPTTLDHFLQALERPDLDGGRGGLGGTSMVSPGRKGLGTPFFAGRAGRFCF